ncbi:hypothetical protein L873DRAFT_1825097 [Choiromyces venosus 120613-1]|uniref:DUF1640-domain-containing protein n=1 Tax=Choiromyces venosus 120613-1 TaxID=1336337 RepID=A0A3N4K5L2_9PEZI|nr:hypothetical protein L873DRAFT_1825097 [Choiromyces venosus 120613-1]
MSLPRLSFLYPPILLKRPLLSNTAFTGLATLALPRSPHRSLALLRYRHGTAVEPIPMTDASKKDTKSSRESPDQTRSKGGGVSPPRPGGEVSEASPPIISTEGSTATTTKPKEGEKPAEVDRSSQPQPTHLAPPPFVHHFDTYSLAKSLESSGFTKGQAVTIMKGVRGLLSNNLEVAKENLVSKSNVENDSYLFHAACSELRNGIEKERNTQIDQLRVESASIQQEFDLLNQRFLEDIMSLKDELNGLFNDRKMVTRAEQRAMENKIQELNYKITILINSEMKSEIEKLRWTTTRRGLIAIGFLAVFVVASIRFSKGEHDEKKRHKDAGPSEERDELNHKLLGGAPHDHLAETLANSESRGPGVSYVSLG